jgi:predicted phage tail protein
VRVSWTAPNNGGSPITSYDVRVVNLAGARVGELWSTTGTALTVTGLQNGRDYFFAVRAVNALGNGKWSQEFGATPVGPPGAPAVQGVDPRNRSVLVRWADPTDNGGSTITGFRVQVQTLDGRQGGALRSADRFANRLLVTNLTNGRAYRFRVQALNALGASPWSGTMRTTPRR